MTQHAAAENFLLCQLRPALCGLVLWGRPTLAEATLLERALDAGDREASVTRGDILLDARRLDGLDADVYEHLERLAAGRANAIRRRVRRQALVRSSGLLGAALSGFHAATGLELDCRVFTELTPALAWLDEPWPEALSQTLDRLVTEVISGARLVDRLRTYLTAPHEPPVSIGPVSRALGTSVRSLQRHLLEHGTSFRKETRRARLALGKRLLHDSDLKIAAVAQRVGFSTEANFIASFRRAIGESPAEWRRHRLSR